MSECRICFESTVPLYRLPCDCRGSLGQVHKECFSRWMETAVTSKCDVCKYAYPVTLHSPTRDIMSWCDTLLTRLILLYLVSLFVILNSTAWCAPGDDVLYWVIEFFLGVVTVNAAWFFVRVFMMVHFPPSTRHAFEHYIVDANSKEP
jgi:hypothetical protein